MKAQTTGKEDEWSPGAMRSGTSCEFMVTTSATKTTTQSRLNLVETHDTLGADSYFRSKKYDIPTIEQETAILSLGTSYSLSHLCLPVHYSFV